MKFSFAYVKQHPVMFGAIVIVFGLAFWLLLNRGASASGGSGSAQIVNAGPTDAEVMAQAQVAIASLHQSETVQQIQGQLGALQMQGDYSLALAGLDSQYKALELASSERLGMASVNASLSGLQSQLDNSLAQVQSNNEFMTNYAAINIAGAVEQQRIGAALQTTLGEQQLKAYEFGTMATLAATLKSKGLAHTFFDGTLPGTSPALAYNPNQSHGGGGSTFGNFLGIIASPILALAKH